VALPADFFLVFSYFATDQVVCETVMCLVNLEKLGFLATIMCKEEETFMHFFLPVQLSGITSIMMLTSQLSTIIKLSNFLYCILAFPLANATATESGNCHPTLNKS
jgi:hypothetical protein